MPGSFATPAWAAQTAGRTRAVVPAACESRVVIFSGSDDGPTSGATGAATGGSSPMDRVPAPVPPLAAFRARHMAHPMSPGIDPEYDVCAMQSGYGGASVTRDSASTFREAGGESPNVAAAPTRSVGDFIPSGTPPSRRVSLHPEVVVDWLRYALSRIRPRRRLPAVPDGWSLVPTHEVVDRRLLGVSYLPAMSGSEVNERLSRVTEKQEVA